MSKKVLRKIARLPTTFNKPSLVCNHYFSLIKEGLKYHIYIFLIIIFFNCFVFQVIAIFICS